MARAAAKAATGGARRIAALGGVEALVGRVRISVLPPAERISLRAPTASVAALSKALGLDLPKAPKTSASSGGRVALWLGPDEWLVIDQTGDPLADCGGVKALHSAVGISHRSVALSVSGPGAAATIGAGCPQDLSLAAFPVGACSRTVLGKVEIVVFRTAEDSFRVECWRSFSDYVHAFLLEAAADAEA
jgi:sarcosine oxidase subunit gamma